jgi:valyl-tRNA synthetase
MPFITEEIWQNLNKRSPGESIMVSQMPSIKPYDSVLLESFESIKEVVAGIRKIRTDNNIPNKDSLVLKIHAGDKGYEPKFNSVILKLGNLTSLDLIAEEIQGAASFMVKSTNCYIPLEGFVDFEEELKKMEEELIYTRGFLDSVMKKLTNERFVSGAPEAVLAKEKAKRADAEAKINVLEDRIGSLKKK